MPPRTKAAAKKATAKTTAKKPSAKRASAKRSVEEKYQGGGIREAVLVGRKGMWAGSQDQTSNKEYVMNIKAGKPEIEYKDIVYPPALYKIFDEVIVNAADHNNEYPTEVSRIEVEFDTTTGRFSVLNNGPGIEVVHHKTAGMWVPEFIFGEFHSTSNFVKDAENTKGGTNGLGAKLTNVLSTEFTVETVDGRTKQKYVQSWRDNMSVKEPPVITPSTHTSYTKVSFIPDYAHFQYKNGWSHTIYTSLVGLIRMRMYMIAATVGKKCAVKFNGDRIPVSCISDIADIMFPKEDILRTTIAPKPKSRVVAENNPWEVCIVVTDRVFDRNERSLSNINGTIARRGKHIKHLSDLLYEGLKMKLTKEFKKDSGLKFHPTLITNNIFILMNARMPGGDWSEQKKHEFEISPDKLARFNITPQFMTDVYDTIKERVIAKLLVPPKRKKAAVDYEKYEPAQKLGPLSTLLVIEGDSAMTQVRDGISNNPDLGFAQYGMISTGGVIINAFKNSKVHQTAQGRGVAMNKTMEGNKFLKSYVDALGININFDYDPASPQYAAEIAKLNYGQVVICTDQDLDGFNINSLLLVLHEQLSPGLLGTGFVKRFNTPVIRAYAKAGARVFEFYTDFQYQEWFKTHDESKYDIKYYKGLATHNDEETVHMFSSFNDHLYTFNMDDAAKERLKIFYGEDTAPRKVELAKPLEELPPELVMEQLESLSYDVTDWLNGQTKEYQLDNLQRKLNHVIDGETESARKIHDGAYKAFKTRTAMKVAQLAGFIAEHECYHHGEQGLAASITGKAFIAAGGKQLPLLLPNSNFGSRNLGGKDAGAPRYIFARYNRPLMDVLFPSADYYRLDFVSSEGEIAEPKFFVPIIPTAITETTEIPGTGWKLKVWARDVFDVISNVRRLIMIDDETELLSMKPAMYKHLGYTGEIRNVGARPYSFGKYTFDEKSNILTITELPLTVWTEKYVSGLKANKMEITVKTARATPKAKAAAKAKATVKASAKKAAPKAKATTKKAAAKSAENTIKIIKSIKNNSNTRKVNIVIKLHPGALKYMKGNHPYTDEIEEYFGLRTPLNHNINLIGIENNVLEFKRYEEIIHTWFPIRKKYYKLRIDYDLLALQLKIRRLKNIIRYVDVFEKLKIPKKNEDTANGILSSHKFDTFDSALLDSPKHTPYDELEQRVLHGKNSSYAYLLATTDAGKLTSAIAARAEKLAKLKEELELYEMRAQEGRFYGARIWLDELDQLEKVIQLGQKTEWQYKKQTKRQFV